MAKPQKPQYLQAFQSVSCLSTSLAIALYLSYSLFLYFTRKLCEFLYKNKTGKEAAEMQNFQVLLLLWLTKCAAAAMKWNDGLGWLANTRTKCKPKTNYKIEWNAEERERALRQIQLHLLNGIDTQKEIMKHTRLHLLFRRIPTIAWHGSARLAISTQQRTRALARFLTFLKRSEDTNTNQKESEPCRTLLR